MIKIKNILLITLLFLSVSFYAQNNVGVGTLTPNVNAALEIESTDKGLLIPRLTTAQRNIFGAGLTNIENSMLVYDVNDSVFYYWKATVWVPIPGINTDDQNIDSVRLNPLDSILTVYIEDGLSASVNLKTAFDNTDEQTLNIIGDSLEISNGNKVLFLDNDTTNETIDSVKYENDTLIVYEGNNIYKTEMVGGEWSDADKIGLTNFIYAKQALNNGNADTVVITDNGRLGVANGNPGTTLNIGDSFDPGTGFKAVSIAGDGIGETRGAKLFMGADQTNFTQQIYQTTGAFPTFRLNQTVAGNLVDDYQFVVSGNGNVGVGTLTPPARLTVNDTNATIFMAAYNGAGKQGISSDGDLFLGGEKNTYIVSDMNAGAALGDIIFGDRVLGYTPTNAKNWVLEDEHMRIDGVTGNVGIATATPTDKLQVNGNVRVGIQKDLPGGAVEPEGWGNVIHFSGGPDVSPGFNSDNSDGFYIGRYNIANDLSELRIRLGDNLGALDNDAFVIGSRSQTLPWTPHFRVQSNGFTGIGVNTTTYPTNQLHVIANTNPLRLEGLQQGASTDSVLTVNNTGVVRQSANPMPAGSIISFAGAAAPAGFLICDGSAISRTDYADLFAVLGTTYGVGNGTTTFNIPDLRGEFIRGADAGKGTDPGRTLGSNQVASPVVGDDNLNAPDDFSMQVAGANQFFDQYDASYAAVNFWYRNNPPYQYNPSNGGGFLRGSRPRNVALNYIIRY